jgi:methionyl aminopeptidase
MAVVRKTFDQLCGIWRAGQVAGRLHAELRQRLRPGVSTEELDSFAEEFIRSHRGTATFKGYRVGRNVFPASLCISIDDEIVHGIPGPRQVSAGQLVSIDLGITLDGLIADTARSWYIGEDGALKPEQVEDDDVRRLMSGTRASLDAAVAAIRPGQNLREVSRAVFKVLHENRLGVIRELTGHGTGLNLHEEPSVENYDPGFRGPRIEEGWVLAVEPMATLGSTEIILGADNWVYRTADGSLAAHYEHTIAVWDGRSYVMTDHEDETAAAVFGK